MALGERWQGPGLTGIGGIHGAAFRYVYEGPAYNERWALPAVTWGKEEECPRFGLET